MAAAAEQRKVGRFIVVEGLDGSGKSTLVDGLAQHYERDGQWTVHRMAFPTRDTPLGRCIQDHLRGGDGAAEQDAEAMHLLFAADRRMAQKCIKEILTDPKALIICDRYAHSGFAYSVAKGLNAKMCIEADRHIVGPDAVILLRGDPEVFMARRGASGQELERYEKLEFQKKVARAYEMLNFISYMSPIDADTLDADAIRAAAIKVIDARLKERTWQSCPEFLWSNVLRTGRELSALSLYWETRHGTFLKSHKGMVGNGALRRATGDYWACIESLERSDRYDEEMSRRFIDRCRYHSLHYAFSISEKADGGRP